ncbi:MAG: ABZJ_00895 family protein [Alphaproteobacteria bacterium]|nr:ABZJ_00895 family protein [Alphaproteobacteria bacterium]
MAANVSFTRYAVCFFVATIVVSALMMATGLAGVKALSGILLLILTTAIVSGVFVHDHRRIPEQKERRKLELVSFLAMTISSLFMMGGTLIADPAAREMVLAGFTRMPRYSAFAFVVIGIVYYVVLVVCYKTWPGFILDKMKKKTR